MPRLLGRNPKYRRHKATDQAVVTLSGRDFYLGPWKSAASKAEYDRRVREWNAAGGVLPRDDADALTIVELLAAFRKHAQTYYVDHEGQPTSELATYQTLIKRFKKLYGRTLAVEFGPLKLKAFRESLVDEKLSRGVVNRTISRVRQIFRWGAENELVPAGIVEALRCVSGLRYGKCKVRETDPVKPVPAAYVDAVLPYVTPQIRAMIELQRVTGMRSGELCRMRGCDLNMSGSVWTYTPARHKTMHHGHSRVVYLGPKAQAILRTWLRSDLQAYLFQPREAEQWRRDQKHKARKTPIGYGNRPGTNQKRKPKKSAGDHYTNDSYRGAIDYGIKRCNAERAKRKEQPIPSWHPHQLRHNHATMVKREHGLEVARVLLGHKHASITEVYAEADRERAVEVVAKIG
jgi:integrase